MVTMHISLDDVVAQELKRRAEQLGRRAEELVAELVRGTIEEDLRYREAVRVGIAAADAGRGSDANEVFDRLRAKILAIKANGAP